MSKILLDYVFPVSVITPTPEASTAFLKQVCLVCTPKSGQEGNVGSIYECVDMDDVGDRTDNEDAVQLFAAGMTKVFILLADDLDLEDALEDVDDFYTLLVSSDFTNDDIATGTVAAVKAQLKIQDILFKARTAGTGGNSITINYDSGGTAGAEGIGVVGSAITVTMEDGVSTAQDIADAIAGDSGANALVECIIDSGDEGDTQDVFGSAVTLTGGVAASAGVQGLKTGSFEGVTGVSIVADDTLAGAQAAISRRAAFKSSSEQRCLNMCFAFGKLLSNLSNWLNQQYISMPESDDIGSLGTANSLFDDRVSFVLDDDQYGTRLALFAAGGKAIVAPYIIKNLEIDMQGRALQWISQNQPQYTIKEAALLENRLQQDVIQEFIDRGWIESGTIAISLLEDNFVGSAEISVPEPTALWRVYAELTQTT